ncbi:ABC transporter ATP-binding protein [Brevundimonas sp. CEF1]|uniref:ABC transporter ATP-binding protein n=1 Tax=Brevundimonas sp. CEF1 TaxID=3442642 RepID=UPI003F516FA9
MAALVGPSGSGKSTLLNLIGLLDEADSGQILVDDRLVSALNATDAARLRNELIGFVFQSFHLLSRLTAWENVALPLFHRGVGRAERKARALNILERVGLSDRVDHRPEQMSGGQRQRVAIARALVGEPRLILADEPTGNLDSVTGLQVMDLLRALNGDLGVTILMVTHDRDMAKLCDRVIEIRDGRVLPLGEAG